MSADNFARCLAVTLAYEGGFSITRADPGNWTGGRVGVGTLAGTNYGISAAAHPTLDIRALTKESVAPIYQAEYWTPAGCDALAAGLDLSHFDATVNGGRTRAAGWLKKAKAQTTVPAQIRAYAGARLTFLEALKSWITFGRGWATRVAGVEAKSLAMTFAAPTGNTASLGITASTVLGRAAARHGRKASAAGRASTMAKAAAGAAVTAGATTAHPAAAGIAGAASLAVALASDFLAWRNGLRAAALSHAT